jgi:hypothetical protein
LWWPEEEVWTKGVEENFLNTGRMPTRLDASSFSDRFGVVEQLATMLDAFYPESPTSHTANDARFGGARCMRRSAHINR